jgi:hypothetical protein
MNAEDISFTTTAMCRPDILNTTLKSFNENIIGLKLKDVNLYINIDPLPKEKGTDFLKYRNQTIEVAKKYFKEVVYRTPEKANFTSAVQWTWQQAQTPLILHLEDDWILKKQANIDDLVRPLMKSKKIIQVVLRAYKYDYSDMKQVCLSPSIISERFYKAVRDKFDLSINPEIQLRPVNKNMNNVNWEKSRIVAYPYKEVKVIVKDIGRKWIGNQNYQKPKTKSNFTSWIEKKNKNGKS